MMATQVSIATGCSLCGAEWPVAPALPSLVGGCKGCRREYGRRYQKDKDYNRRHYAAHAESRRESSRRHYHSSGRRFAKYSMTRAQFEEMYREQNGCCAICTREIDESKAHIDHDHTTGAVRGLLCMGCNRALGYFGDNADNIERALVYLNNKKEIAHAC